MNISAEGELKLYRGRNRIYSGKRLDYDYFKAFKILSYSLKQN